MSEKQWAVLRRPSTNVIKYSFYSDIPDVENAFDIWFEIKDRNCGNQCSNNYCVKCIRLAKWSKEELMQVANIMQINIKSLATICSYEEYRILIEAFRYVKENRGIIAPYLLDKIFNHFTYILQASEEYLASRDSYIMLHRLKKTAALSHTEWKKCVDDFISINPHRQTRSATIVEQMEQHYIQVSTELTKYLPPELKDMITDYVV